MIKPTMKRIFTTLDETVPKVHIPEGQCGDWKIEKFVVSENNIRQKVLAVLGRRHTPPGIYTKLTHKGITIMSDTPDERRDILSPIIISKGNMLIAGLGLGVVLNACAQKEEVEKITIIEKSIDVLKLISPFYLLKKYSHKLLFIHADIFDWKPPKNAWYDIAWYDIWNTICEDNLEEMKKLHRKFARRTEWQGSWSRSILEEMRKKRGGF